MKRIEVVWREVKSRRFSSEKVAKEFLKSLLTAEEVEVFECDGDETTAWIDFGPDHLKPRKFERNEMDG